MTIFKNTTLKRYYQSHFLRATTKLLKNMPETANPAINQLHNKIFKKNRKMGRENIKLWLPVILKRQANYGVSEVCQIIGSIQRKKIVGQLFLILEYELHNISKDSDLAYINKIIYYITEFSESKGVDKLFIYRKTKMITHIIEAKIRAFNKHNLVLAYLNSIALDFHKVNSAALILTGDPYIFISSFIYEIRDLKDIKKVLEKNPQLVNLHDRHGVPLIVNLVDTLIKGIMNRTTRTNIYLLTYYQTIIELLVNNKRFVKEENTKQIIAEKIALAMDNLDSTTDKQKLLWLKSLCQLTVGTAFLTPEEVITKYNVGLLNPALNKEKYQLNKAGRAIITGPKIITIDDVHSRDLDDAITLEKLDNKYLLTVFISDIPTLVKKDTLTDIKARQQGESFYFPNETIPMLPFSVTNDLGSLTPGTLKNVLAFKLILNQNGELEELVDISEACTRTDNQLSFRDVNRILTSGAKDYQLESMLNNMAELATILRSKNKRINFDFDFDSGIHLPHERSHAHKIIEEFMILVNVSTASLISQMPDVPYIFRNHHFDRSEVISKIQEALEKAYTDSCTEVITDIIQLLASIKDNARYSAVNSGHEALAAPAYGRVTAGIRRYCDLENQRIIHDFILREPTLAKMRFYDLHLEALIREQNNRELINRSAHKEYTKSKALIRKERKEK